MTNIMPDKHFSIFNNVIGTQNRHMTNFIMLYNLNFFLKNMISPWIILECVQLHLDLSCNDACGENSLKRSL